MKKVLAIIVMVTMLILLSGAVFAEEELDCFVVAYTEGVFFNMTDEGYVFYNLSISDEKIEIEPIGEPKTSTAARITATGIYLDEEEFELSDRSIMELPTEEAKEVLSKPVSGELLTFDPIFVWCPKCAGSLINLKGAPWLYSQGYNGEVEVLSLDANWEIFYENGRINIPHGDCE